MVGIKDYENMDGFGMSTWEEVANLNKALSAGYDIPATSGGVSGSALRVESLEASLKVITFQMQHIKFWQKIPKLPAYSTVEEYNQLTSYGSDAGAFTPEGTLGEYDDATYARKTSLIKYLQTVRKVTHPLTLVRAAHGDVVGNEIRNGIMWLLGKIEYALYWGDSTLKFSGEGYEWDGLQRLIDTTQVIDALGDPLSEDIIETASNQIVEQFGFPTDIFIGTRPLADLAKVMFPKERIVMPYRDGTVGVPLNTFASQAGNLAFNPDVLLKKRTPPTVATSTLAPNAPNALTAVRSATGGGATTTGNWTKTNNGYGAYYYTATMGNRYGESAGIAEVLATGSIVADTDYIAVTVSTPLVVTNMPEYYNVYRSVANAAAGATKYLVYSVKLNNQTANTAQTAWNDLNSICANTHKVFMGELTPQVICFKQLAPMMKMDLAVTEPAFRWLQLLYGTMQLYAPKKWCIIKNIGEASV